MFFNKKEKLTNGVADNQNFVYSNQVMQNAKAQIGAAYDLGNKAEAQAMRTAYDNRAQNLQNLISSFTAGIPDDAGYKVTGTNTIVAYNVAIERFVNLNQMDLAKQKREEFITKFRNRLVDIDNATAYTSSANGEQYLNAKNSVKKALEEGDIGSAQRIFKDYVKSAEEKVKNYETKMARSLKQAGLNNKEVIANGNTTIEPIDQNATLIQLVYSNRCNHKYTNVNTPGTTTPVCPYANGRKTISITINKDLSSEQLESIVNTAISEADTIPCRFVKDKIKKSIENLKSDLETAWSDEELSLKFGLGDHPLGKITAVDANNPNVEKAIGKTKCCAEIQINGEKYNIVDMHAVKSLNALNFTNQTFDDNAYDLLTLNCEGQVVKTSELTAFTREAELVSLDNFDARDSKALFETSLGTTPRPARPARPARRQQPAQVPQPVPQTPPAPQLPVPAPAPQPLPQVPQPVPQLPTPPAPAEWTDLDNGLQLFGVPQDIRKDILNAYGSRDEIRTQATANNQATLQNFATLLTGKGIDLATATNIYTVMTS